MHLDQRRHPQPLRLLAHSDQLNVRERGDDEQDEVGAVGPRLEELIRLHHEVLAQHGDPHGGAHRVKVGQRPGEASLLSEDGDRGGSAGGIRTRQGRRVGNVREGALAGAGPLDLSDHGDAGSGPQGGLCVEGGRHRRDPGLEVSQARAGDAVSEIEADASNDLVENGGCGRHRPRLRGQAQSGDNHVIPGTLRRIQNATIDTHTTVMTHPGASRSGVPVTRR